MRRTAVCAMLTLVLFSASACCASLSDTRRLPAPPEALVILRSVAAGSILGRAPRSTRPRSNETWEIRIWPDGTVQEARGWKGSAGVLMRPKLDSTEVADLVAEVHALKDLPEYLGHVVTDTPYRELEFTAGGERHVIAAFPSELPDPGIELFDRTWRALVARFPECRLSVDWIGRSFRPCAPSTSRYAVGTRLVIF